MGSRIRSGTLDAKAWLATIPPSAIVMLVAGLLLSFVGLTERVDELAKYVWKWPPHFGDVASSSDRERARLYVSLGLGAVLAVASTAYAIRRRRSQRWARLFTELRSSLHGYRELHPRVLAASLNSVHEVDESALLRAELLRSTRALDDHLREGAFAPSRSLISDVAGAAGDALEPSLSEDQLETGPEESIESAAAWAAVARVRSAATAALEAYAVLDSTTDDSAADGDPDRELTEGSVVRSRIGEVVAIASLVVGAVVAPPVAAAAATGLVGSVELTASDDGAGEVTLVAPRSETTVSPEGAPGFGFAAPLIESAEDSATSDSGASVGSQNVVGSVSVVADGSADVGTVSVEELSGSVLVEFPETGQRFGTIELTPTELSHSIATTDCAAFYDILFALATAPMSSDLPAAMLESDYVRAMNVECGDAADIFEHFQD